MNEITIAINYDNDNPTISGRELHKALGIKDKHSQWFSRMCEYGFSEGQDFFTILGKVQEADLLQITLLPLIWQKNSV